MYKILNALIELLKKLLPASLVRPLLPFYHRTLAFLLAASYGFPAKRLTVIGVTGTKGKSSVSDMLFSVLRHAGYPAAVAGTIRFAINDESEPNLYKMTMPGRGFIHAFLAKAVKAGAKYAVVEITSESTRQHRHWGDSRSPGPGNPWEWESESPESGLGWGSARPEAARPSASGSHRRPGARAARAAVVAARRAATRSRG